MLPAVHRMRLSSDFEAAVRRGQRAGRRCLVVHLAVRPLDDPGDAPVPTKVGFVVSRAVGNAVVRNQVKRRLRAAMAARLPGLPGGALVVVRAQPAAASATGPALLGDLDVALPRVLEAAAVASRRDGVQR